MTPSGPYIAQPYDSTIVKTSTVLDSLKLNDAELGAGNETVTIQSLNGTFEVTSTTIGTDSLVRASAMQAAPTKATPVDADGVIIIDSAASNAIKRTLWSSIKSTLKTYFDTLYPRPSQTGNSGKFLTTDGTSESWATVTAPTWGNVTGTLSSQTDLKTALDAKLASTFTKAQLDTAISDGNAVYVGDALNGTLGATTPATVACTTVNASGVVTATSTGTHTFGTTNTVTMAAGALTTTGTLTAGGANNVLVANGSTFITTIRRLVVSESFAFGSVLFETGSPNNRIHTNGNIGLVLGQNSNNILTLPRTDTGNECVLLTIPGTTNKGMIIRGAASQSANLLECQTSTPATVFSVGPAGVLTASGVGIHNFGSTTGVNYIASNGGAITTGEGSAFICFNGGAAIGGIGNRSLFTGGAYDGSFCVKSGNYVTAAPMLFLVGLTERMRLSTGGKLLVGTATDDGINILQVSGGMTAVNGTFSGTVTSGVYTVATLPSAASNARARAFVSDSNLAYNSTNLGSTVTAGGANLVPVWSNGTNWVIG